MSRRSSPLRIVILISGRGSNMLAIAEHVRDGTTPAEIVAVMSNRADAPGLASAAALGIPIAVVSPDDHADRTAYDSALAERVAVDEPDLIVLAGFMLILGPAFLERFEGRMLNIHPSLLPRYRGLHTHRRVLEAGEHEHGASVHFVTEDLDGGPIVIQGRVAVRDDDSVETLSARVQRAEHSIYPQAVDWFARGRLTWKDGRAWLDGQPLDSPVCIDFTFGD